MNSSEIFKKDKKEDINNPEGGVDSNKRKIMTSWKQFYEAANGIKYQIQQGVENLENEKEQEIKEINELQVDTEDEKERLDFENKKAKKIDEVRVFVLEGKRLGEKAQAEVDALSEEIIEKGTSEEPIIQEEEGAIEDPIGKEIIKAEEIYKKFLEQMNDIKRQMKESLIEVKEEWRRLRIEEIEEGLKKDKAKESNEPEA